MTNIKDFTSQEKAKLFLGAVLGFAAGFLIAPIYDKSKEQKVGLSEIIGAIIGFVIAYLLINYNHKK